MLCSIWLLRQLFDNFIRAGNLYPDMVSICVFGDSIGEGYYDSEKGGWVSQLSRFLKIPNNNLHLYNCSISGESTREVLIRFDTEIKAREPKKIIFALGTNDSWHFDGDKNKPNVSLNEFKENLKALISRSKKINAKIIFIGAPKVDESKVMPIPWRKEIFYDNENIREYNKTLEQICKKYNLKFIETYNLLDNEDFSDGLHPNTKGHTKLFEEIKKQF